MAAELRNDILLHLEEYSHPIHRSVSNLYEAYGIDVSDNDTSSTDFIASVFYLGVVFGIFRTMLPPESVVTIFKSGNLSFLGVHEQFLSPNCCDMILWKILLNCKSKCGLL